MPRSAASFWIGLIASFSRIAATAGEFDHRAGDVDLLRGRQALHAGGDIDGLAEIILPLVEHHRQAWAFVDADLDDQILGAALRR